MQWSSFCCGVLAVSLYLGVGFWLAVPLVALAVIGIEMLVAAAYPGSAKYNGARKKMMIGSWSEPQDPSIFTEMSIDVSKLPAYLEEASKKTGEKLTVTHLVVKAMGIVLKGAPGFRGRLVFSRFVPFDEVDISCLVVLEKSDNLSVYTVRNADKVPLQTVASKLRAAATKLRSNQDKDFEKTVKSQSSMPAAALRFMIWLAGFLTNSLGLDVPGLGARRFHFGCCMITSLGSIGVDKSIVPSTPYARVPMTISVGMMSMQPACVGEGEDCKVVPRLTLPVNFTIDHRFVDGAGTLTMAKTFRKIMADPASYSLLEEA